MAGARRDSPERNLAEFHVHGFAHLMPFRLRVTRLSDEDGVNDVEKLASRELGRLDAGEDQTAADVAAVGAGPRDKREGFQVGRSAAFSSSHSASFSSPSIGTNHSAEPTMSENRRRDDH